MEVRGFRFELRPLDRIVLEDLYSIGHGADLVPTADPDDLDRRVRPGDPAHDGGHGADRPGDPGDKEEDQTENDQKHDR